MLKNKFGITKILVLALSVLMLVSLVACNKTEGVTDEAMQNAIKDALDKAASEQAEKDASLKAEQDALQSALADAQAKADQAQKDADKAKEDADQAKKDADAAKDAATATTTTKATTTTTTKATTTTAVVKEDISAQVAEYSKLKTEYTYTNESMYLAKNYAELVAVFDKAGVELNNAMTVKAAQDILAALKVDVAAVESIKTRAATLGTQISALGDIESEVFTTAAAKVDAVKKAYEQLNKDYKDNKNLSDKNLTKYGANIADLNKAIAKVKVLKAYIAESLQADMIALYNAHEIDFDEEGDDLNATNKALIKDAYYKYRVLSVVNGGDVSAADVAIDWEIKLDAETGKKVVADATAEFPLGGTYGERGEKYLYDTKKPVAYFTADQFIEVYAYVYLNDLLNDTIYDEDDGILAKVEAALSEDNYSALIPAVKTPAFAATYDDVEDAFEAIYEKLEADYEALSFVGDYKGNATIGTAQKDVKIMAVKAYIEAISAFVEASKAVAIENQTEATEDAIDALNDDIDDVKDQIADVEDNAAKLERLNAKVASLQEDIAQAKADLEAFKANVNAAAMLTYDQLQSKEVAKSDDYKNISVDLSKLDVAKITAYVKAVAKDVVDDNFKAVVKEDTGLTQEGDLRDMILLVVEDLEALRVRVNPAIDLTTDGEDEQADSDIFWAFKGGVSTSYDPYSFKNIAKFEAIVAEIDAALEAIKATTAENYKDIEKVLIYKEQKDSKKKDYGFSKKELYFVNEAAKNYAEEQAEKANQTVAAWALANAEGKSDMFTATANDYPVATFNYTAAMQATEAVYDKYVATFKSVHSQIAALENWDITKTTELITKDAEFVAIKKTVNSTLAASMDAVAKVYTDKIAKLDDDTIAYADVNLNAVKADSVFTLAKFENEWTCNVDVDSIGNADAYSITDKAAFKDAVLNNHKDGTAADIVAAFETAFWADEAQTTSNVTKLEDHKIAAVKAITDKVAEYKNVYILETAEGANKGKYKVTVNGIYAYDNASEYVVAKSANANTYEAQLDTLLADAIAAINGITLNETADVEIKDHLGNVIYKFAKNSPNLTNAKKAVDAYVIDLLGYEAAKALGYASSNDGIYTSTVWEGYANADSDIFVAYKALFVTSYATLTLTKK